MSNINKHGLSRYIPAQLKRDVRVCSKFGFVFCRSAIYQYEHITPEFSDATEHDSDHICVLCGRCHENFIYARAEFEKFSNVFDEERFKTHVGEYIDDYEVEILISSVKYLFK